MAFISSLFLSELTFQRSSVVKVVVKGMTSSFQFFNLVSGGARGGLEGAWPPLRFQLVQ